VHLLDSLCIQQIFDPGSFERAIFEGILKKNNNQLNLDQIRAYAQLFSKESLPPLLRSLAPSKRMEKGDVMIALIDSTTPATSGAWIQTATQALVDLDDPEVKKAFTHFVQTLPTPLDPAQLTPAQRTLMQNVTEGTEEM